MKSETRQIMGMPITIVIADPLPDASSDALLRAGFEVFREEDLRFSPYRPESELSRFDAGEIATGALSREMQEILDLSETAKRESSGVFDIRRPDGHLDPSGLVKGWAIRRAAERLTERGARNFFVDAGGDVQTMGAGPEGAGWRIGIRHPFSPGEIVKVLRLQGMAVATSGTYARGDHIYDPRQSASRKGLVGQEPEIVSLSVIGTDIFEADRAATIGFALGRDGIAYIEEAPGLEGYMIDAGRMATMTTGFGAYVTT